MGAVVHDTREARDASGEIHDRMPTFLLPDLWDDWLTPDKLDDKDAMLERLASSSEQVAATITTHRVDRKVNSTQKADPSDPSLIVRIDCGGGPLAAGPRPMASLCGLDVALPETRPTLSRIVVGLRLADRCGRTRTGSPRWRCRASEPRWLWTLC